jgi:prophage tail gpP-like protein
MHWYERWLTMLDFIHLGFQLLLHVVFCISKISVITVLDNVVTVSQKSGIHYLSLVWILCSGSASARNHPTVQYGKKKINQSSKWVYKQLQSRFLEAANSEMGFLAARKWRESGNVIFNGLKAYIIGTNKSTTCCFIAEEMVIWKNYMPVER